MEDDRNIIDEVKKKINEIIEEKAYELVKKKDYKTLKTLMSQYSIKNYDIESLIMDMDVFNKDGDDDAYALWWWCDLRNCDFGNDNEHFNINYYLLQYANYNKVDRVIDLFVHRKHKFDLNDFIGISGVKELFQILYDNKEIIIEHQKILEIEENPKDWEIIENYLFKRTSKN